SYYLKDYAQEAEADGTVHGAYGPRLFGDAWGKQFHRVADLLNNHPTSRRAVIQLFDHRDLHGQYRDIPCTSTLQFMVRGNDPQRLDLIVTMRSNDAFIGLPHDVFSFTMLQEIMARMLNTEVGEYAHFAGSLHVYDRHAKK